MARSPSTVASIVAKAYREPNIVALGQTATDDQTAEGVDALNSFMLTALGMDIGEPLFDWLAPAPQRTAPVSANWPQGPLAGNAGGGSLMLPIVAVTPYPPNNARVIWGGNASTVYFPERPENGARLSLVQGSGLGDNGQNGNVLTLDANGRYIGQPGQTPNFSATQQFTFSTTAPQPVSADWLYVSAYGMWMPVGALALTDIMITPPEYDTYFIVGCAGRLAPHYNKTLSTETQAAYALSQSKVKSEFAQKHDTIYGAWEIPNTLQSYAAGRWLGAFWG